MIVLSVYSGKDWEAPRVPETTADLPGMNLKVLKTKKSGYQIKLEYIL